MLTHDQSVRKAEFPLKLLFPRRGGLCYQGVMVGDSKTIGELKISRPSRRCATENRPLTPGEVYFSVLVPREEDFERIDISQKAWQGPPEDAIGWWKNRLPMPSEKKRELAPPEVLVDLLRSMLQQPQRAKSRYLLALLLLRKRHLRVCPSPSAPPAQSGEPGEADEMLHLESSLDRAPIDIPVCAIAPAEARRLQDELIELIYRDVETVD